MDRIKLEILGLSSSQSQSGSFALVLGEKNGSRRLPIIIGMFEAQAIAIEIEKIIPNRPMTHDLFKAFAGGFDYTIQEIIISDLKEGVFFAKIVANNGIKEKSIDARPSDAIAIGLRFDVPIYTYENILSEAGIEFSEETEEDVDQTKVEAKITVGGGKSDEKIKDHTFEKLNELLEEALKKEDYEVAAKIRDEMNRRN